MLRRIHEGGGHMGFHFLSWLVTVRYEREYVGLYLETVQRWAKFKMRLSKAQSFIDTV